MHDWGHSSPVECHGTLNHTRNVSNGKAVVRYAERLLMTCSFQVIYVQCNYAQMVYRKDTVMRVWSHNSQIISCIQL